jgi:hypothetical protein
MHCEMTIFVFSTCQPISGVPAAAVPSRSAPWAC